MEKTIDTILFLLLLFTFLLFIGVVLFVEVFNYDFKSFFNFVINIQVIISIFTFLIFEIVILNQKGTKRRKENTWKQ